VNSLRREGRNINRTFSQVAVLEVEFEGNFNIQLKGFGFGWTCDAIGEIKNQFFGQFNLDADGLYSAKDGQFAIKLTGKFVPARNQGDVTRLYTESEIEDMSSSSDKDDSSGESGDDENCSDNGDYDENYSSSENADDDSGGDNAEDDGSNTKSITFIYYLLHNILHNILSFKMIILFIFFMFIYINARRVAYILFVLLHILYILTFLCIVFFRGVG